jgi:MEMO1 family protein
MRIREPAVAGLFYPRQPAELQTEVQSFLAAGKTRLPPAQTRPKALVGPHAGYRYSGDIAGTAYATVALQPSGVTRVVLFSPAHRVAVRGVAASSAQAFRTPLGIVPVECETVESLLSLPGVKINDAAHEPEHGVETHLPFLQEILSHRTSDQPETQPRWSLVPLLVGNADPQTLLPLIEKLWGGPETLIVISSDLSHFLDYDAAKTLDRKTADAIEQLDPDAFVGNSACGRIPLHALMMVAKNEKLGAATLDLRNSGDTAGPRDQVVGYGAFVFI